MEPRNSGFDKILQMKEASGLRLGAKCLCAREGALCRLSLQGSHCGWSVL